MQVYYRKKKMSHNPLSFLLMEMSFLKFLFFSLNPFPFYILSWLSFFSIFNPSKYKISKMLSYLSSLSVFLSRNKRRKKKTSQGVYSHKLFLYIGSGHGKKKGERRYSFSFNISLRDGRERLEKERKRVDKKGSLAHT